MLQMFTEEITLLNIVLTPDGSGGNSISYVESETKWRARVSEIKSGFAEDQPGLDSRDAIRIVGEVRDDVGVRDRLIYQSKTWEITSVRKIGGIGTIPDYLRVDAVSVSGLEES